MFPSPDAHVGWAGGAERGGPWPSPGTALGLPAQSPFCAAGLATVAAGADGLVWAWLPAVELRVVSVLGEERRARCTLSLVRLVHSVVGIHSFLLPEICVFSLLSQ